VLHRLAELDALVRGASDTHEWVGVVPALHNFCASDLSAFYFDVRKDALYCDAPSSLRRRAVRTVLDHLHRCLCTWLAPVLVFTAEEAWTSRFGTDGSVHLEQFPLLPEEWLDPELGERWVRLRAVRRLVTTAIEGARRDGLIGASLQAELELPLAEAEAAEMADIDWAELAIVSRAEVRIEPDAQPLFATLGGDPGPGGGFVHRAPEVRVAPGQKCARCWRVLEEVGTHPAHPALCLRCASVVDELPAAAGAAP
jgi:isoleucyl-tRNA synthetase